MAIADVGEIEAPPLETVPVDARIGRVIESMLSRKFSQMGLTRDGEFVGVVSFQSIARALLVTDTVLSDPGGASARVAEFAVENPKTVRKDNDMEDLFDLLGDRSYVLVHDDSVVARDDGTVPYRIITDYDIREYWREATEPFLLIEETELRIRSIIHAVMGSEVADALEAVSEDSDTLRPVTKLEDCSFAHYRRLISVRWDDGFDTYFSEKPDFIRELIGRLNENRNRLFHFRVDDRSELDQDIIDFAHGYFTSFTPDTASQPDPSQHST
ncbi:CBS domain-containing protein [Halobellus ruber]|uniref:CBS domain-containing protein n=1 Tax=Halobellus ruber TaxID=2761102 RepID=A0A7J9SJ47_9EURY|nr:CBS domain-containing protein [Halobellus ruber]MBB6646562.1 CBS domain-containing protein [Halobellus ruber]